MKEGESEVTMFKNIFYSVFLFTFLLLIGSERTFAETNLIVLESPHSFDKTVKAIEQAIRPNNMGITAKINAQTNLARVGIKIRGNQIFEIFRPDYAKRIFDRNLQAGIEPPLRIYIYEAGNKTFVVYRKPSSIFKLYDDPVLMDIGKKLDVILEKIIKTAFNNYK